MSNVATVLNLKRLKGYADWNLLLFLLLFLNVKLAVKIPAIIIIYLLQFDFKFGFKLKASRLPLFYPLVIIIALIDFILYHNHTTNYLIVFVTGTFFWVLCILATHQVKLSVEKNDIDIIHRTLLVFFVVNCVISLLNLAFIVRETGALNPFTYQGERQKYFISTGDFIKGLTFDTSTTNAIINAFGIIYFLTRKNAVMLLVCMATLLLTGSNFVNLAILIILIPIFIFKTNREQKSLLVICLAFFVVFSVKISPQNSSYAIETFKTIIHAKKSRYVPPVAEIPVTQKPDSILNPEEKRQKIAGLYLDSIYKIIEQKRLRQQAYLTDKRLVKTENGRIVVPKPNLNLEPYQGSIATPPEQLPLVAFIKTHKANLPISSQSNFKPSLPGKAIGLLQTLNFLKQHPAKILTGTGIGNFSSKLAFRTSGLGVTGGYPAKYVYINPDFEQNHLDLYLNFFSKRADYHSLTHSPFSVYDQLLSEYGLLGLLALLICYLGFFAKHYKQLTYGIPLLAFVAIVFFIDYWFEQLSVMVLFELLLFLNIKEGGKLVTYER